MTCFFWALVFSGFIGCADPAPVVSPPGYHLDQPKKFIMSESLREISGIVCLRGNADTLYAIEDEEGKLFYFHPGDGKFPYQKFGKRGDYEDVTIWNDQEFVVLRSDGSLFVFPLSIVKDGNTDNVEKYENILPTGEYEGLFGDGTGRLIALCKHCPEEDRREEVSGYELGRGEQGGLTVKGHFTVDVSTLKLTSRKTKFHPSCLARHPLTGEWYIISSVNKILVVLDDHWKVKAGYPLDPSLFKQPEGLAFDSRGNMYISNEGGQGNANVLLFRYTD
ncbi:MAG TPA: hypothetical protein VL832_12555 [Puia sp.]|jgi:hypothetical protein|nr:hypothetical protein [Puia sp.]